MLTRYEGPDGPYWVRSKFDAKKYSFPKGQLELIASWRNQGSVASLLKEHHGPFDPYTEVGRIVRDGRTWVRFYAPTFEYCFDVEILPQGTMGELVGVPPEEAWALALERDKRGTARIITEE